MSPNIYGMSSIGKCARALSAEKLGYKPEPVPLWVSRAGKEGKWHEKRLIDELRATGYTIKDQQKELIIEKDGYQIVGHIDGVIVTMIASMDLLLEIKTMSQYEFNRWMKGGFREFPKYADQLTCYMEAGGLRKTAYLVKNRSSGYVDGLRSDGFIDPQKIIEGFPSDPNVIYSKISAVEMSVAKGEMCSIEFSPVSLECRRCTLRTQICLLSESKLTVATESELLVAASLVKEGRALKKTGKKLFEDGKATLGMYLASISPDVRYSFRIGGEIVSRFKVPTYGDATTYPREKLEEIVPEEFLAQVRVTKPAEWRVNVRAEKEETEEESEEDAG